MSIGVQLGKGGGGGWEIRGCMFAMKEDDKGE